MTHEKARELFSAYSEGTLDAGLTRAFKQKLASDSVLATEYEQFGRTLDGLKLLKDREILIPDDLGEKIAARLDKHIWEAKQRSKPSWNSWFRGLAFSGIAAVVVLGTVVSLGHRNTGPVGSSFAGMPGATDQNAGDQVMIVKTATGVHLKFSPSSPKTLTVYTEPGNQKVTVLKVNGAVDTPLINPNTNAGLLRIEVDGSKDATLVALPGQSSESTRAALRVNKGRATVEDLALALATVYTVPVEVQATDLSLPVNWTFKGSDARSAAAKALDGLNYSVDLRDNGLICIQSN